MNLNGKWKLYYYKHGTKDISNPCQLKQQEVPCVDATVPGNVQLDLSAAGILPKDLFYADNILLAEEYDCYDWWYKTEFKPENHKENEKVVLHFGAVDCFAEYYLNGEKIGESDNMYIDQEFDVTDKLKYGENNTLYVYIKSPLAVLGEKEVMVGNNYHSWHVAGVIGVNCRKAPHSFGWDIMPRAVTSGIWRDVTLEYKPIYGFRSLYFVTSRADEKEALIRLYIDCDVPVDMVFKKMKIVVEGKCQDSEFKAESIAMCKADLMGITIKNPKLWWPRNYGEPNLYDITVTAYTLEGEKLFSKQVRQGFRNIRLDRTEILTNGNGKFHFIVNNVPVMLVGSNWVPMDAYHSRDKQRYKKALEMAVDVNCNVLRCWGGNVYEDHEFFDFCDENGILVWQDFAMACMFYPQTREFYDKLTEEITSVVKKLRNHTSLAVWSGDNEVDFMLASAGFKPSINKITRELIPTILDNLDPVRPYIPSSPYISDEAFKLGESSYPENHLWGPRDYHKTKYYLDSRACFVSEMGYHGCPSRESIEKFIAPEYVWPYHNNPQWILHSSDQKGNPSRTMLMENQIRQMFGTVPSDIDEFVNASQICQAEAKKFFIERVRLQMNRMGGIIWWNLVDGWPQMSDAVVDYYYDKKLAYHYIKRSSQPFIIAMGEAEVGGYPIICANSTRKPVSGKLTVINAETDEVMFEGNFAANANSNTRIGKIILAYCRKGMMILKWETEEGTFFNNYLYGTPGFDLEDYKKWLNKLETLEKSI